MKSRARHKEMGAPENWIMAYARPDAPRQRSQLGIWTGDQTLLVKHTNKNSFIQYLYKLFMAYNAYA